MGRPFLAGDGVIGRMVEVQTAWAARVNAAMEHGTALQKEYARGAQDMVGYLVDLIGEMLPDAARKDGEK